MDKKIKAFIEDEYKEIYLKLNENWSMGFRTKKEELSHRGLLNSGIAQRALTDFTINLVNDNNLKIKDLILNSQKKFNFKMTKEEIESYINKSIENNSNYFDIFYKDLLDYFSSKRMLIVKATSSISFSNAKANNKAELEKIKKELILMNDSQNLKEQKENRKIKKANIIGIIGIIVTVISIVVTIISII